MELSDCPHAVGTAEHSAWIRDVYIPTVNDQRMAEDGAKVGAESQGRKVIHGFTHNLDGTPKRDSFYDDPMAERIMSGIGTWPIKSFSFTRLEEGDLDLGITDHDDVVWEPHGIKWDDLTYRPANNFKVFFEEFTGITGLIEPRTISFDVEVPPWMRRVLFDYMPEVSGSSYTSGGRANRRVKPVKAKRERNQMVPKKVRECPRHGGPADRCRICQR